MSDTELSNEMKSLYNAVTKITSLLSNPELGMSSWNEMLGRAVVENQRALCSLGVTPESCGIQLKENNDERQPPR